MNCYFTCGKPPRNHASSPSLTSSRSWSSLGKEPLYQIPERWSSRYGHEHWQRRNSLSSQKAIYPHRYQSYDQRPRYASYSLPPNRYSSTLRSVSEGPGMELSDRNLSMTSSQSGKTWTTVESTRRSTTSSLPRSRASSNPERGDLRREKGGDASATAAGAVNIPPLPAIPPPAWAPTLSHTPLSADPTLRALSTGKLSRPILPHSRSTPDLAVQPLKIKKGESSVPVQAPAPATVQPATSQTAQRVVKSTSPRKQAAPPMPSGPPPPPPVTRPPNNLAQPARAAPALPTRAPGHSAKPSTGGQHVKDNVSTNFRPRASTNPSSGTLSQSTHSARRPDATRYRQYQHHLHTNSNSQGSFQDQLPLHHYQYQRVWKHGAGPVPASRNSSVYSASSYGTHVTDARTSVMTRGSHACMPRVSEQPRTNRAD